MTKILFSSDTHRGFSQNTSRIHDRWAETFLQEEFDIVVLGGDLSSHRKKQFRDALRWWRQVLGKTTTILLARGNHCLWDRSTRNLEGLRNHLHHEWFAEFNIHHLESAGPFWMNNVCFVGWDGWYHRTPYTNDLRHIRGTTPAGNTWHWLQLCAMHGFEAALRAAEQAKLEGKSVVAVTHFPIIQETPENPRYRHHNPGSFDGNYYYGERLREHADLLLYGHSHHGVDQIVGNTRVVNCGSDYERPKHIILEI